MTDWSVTEDYRARVVLAYWMAEHPSLRKWVKMRNTFYELLALSKITAPVAGLAAMLASVWAVMSLPLVIFPYLIGLPLALFLDTSFGAMVAMRKVPREFDYRKLAACVPKVLVYYGVAAIVVVVCVGVGLYRQEHGAAADWLVLRAIMPPVGWWLFSTEALSVLDKADMLRHGELKLGWLREVLESMRNRRCERDVELLKQLGVGTSTPEDASATPPQESVDG